MIALLAELAGRKSEENYFVGSASLERAKHSLENLPDDAKPLVRASHLGNLGWKHMRYGNNSEAILHLEEAVRLIESVERSQYTTIHRDLILAYLRLAENQNCCAKPSPQSCLFPLQGLGIHGERTGGEKALEQIQKILPRLKPQTESRLELEWLANIAVMILGESPSALPESWRMPANLIEATEGSFPEFRNIAAKAGVDTFGLAGGAVADDFDGDGDFDLVVTKWDPGENMLYFENQGGAKFVDRTENCNLVGLTGGLNIRHADFDNDGDLDLLILRGAWLGTTGNHPNSLLRNDGPVPGGGVRFTDVTFAVGLGDVHYPTQTAEWADFDLDGDLDLFVGNESWDQKGKNCQLFRNDLTAGTSKFVDIAQSAGVDVQHLVKGVACGDYDNDGFPDLYLSCLSGSNLLFRNLGNNRFLDVSAYNMVSDPQRSFPTWFWDFNNDGHLDLFASDYWGAGGEWLLYSRGIRRQNRSKGRLYQNDGNGGFRSVEEETGFDMPMLPMGCNYGDLCNDGFLDVYLGTGDPDFASIVPNLLISNEGGKFVNRTVASRLGHLQKGHGVSMADFDRDGDIDIFEQMGGAYRGDPYYDALFENPGNGNHWISIALRGRQSNSFGIGSRVRVVVRADGGEYSLYQWMNEGSSFGANPLELHFGLGATGSVARIEVFWPKTGSTQVIEKDIGRDRRIEIVEK